MRLQWFCGYIIGLAVGIWIGHSWNYQPTVAAKALTPVYHGNLNCAGVDNPTVAWLPSHPNNEMKCVVTDAENCVTGQTVTGSGDLNCIVTYEPTSKQWYVAPPERAIP